MKNNFKTYNGFRGVGRLRCMFKDEKERSRFIESYIGHEGRHFVASESEDNLDEFRTVMGIVTDWAILGGILTINGKSYELFEKSEDFED